MTLKEAAALLGVTPCKRPPRPKNRTRNYRVPHCVTHDCMWVVDADKCQATRICTKCGKLASLHTWRTYRLGGDFGASQTDRVCP